jgi:HTH-type transcriptional regulator/antitoxin HigA
LLSANAPCPIKTETDLLSLEAQIWDLLAVNERTPAQEAYLTLLSSLVERWESEHVMVPAVHGFELVKALLLERQLRQKDLLPVFGTESIVSEVLSGKRGLQAKHIEGFAAFFHVSPAAFFSSRVPLFVARPRGVHRPQQGGRQTEGAGIGSADQAF